MESPILCWWGDEVRIIDSRDECSVHVLGKQLDPVPGILKAAAGCKGAGRVRIVYQPDALEVHEVGLAGLSLDQKRAGSAGRKSLRPLLAREVAALSEPGAVWCLAPNDSGAGGALLYLERNSPLPRIVEGLGRNGLRTEGAWPLPIVAEWPPSPGAGRGSLSLIASANRAIVGCVNAAGDRSVDFHFRGDIPGAAAASLRSALARFDEADRPPGWLAVDEGPASAALRPAATGLGLAESSVAGILHRVRLLAPGGLADLLPERPWWRRSGAQRRLAAGAVVLLLLSSALCVQTAAARKNARLALMRREEAARLRVRAEAGELQTRIGRMRFLVTSAAELKAARPVHGDFLIALAGSFPRNAVLGEVAINDGQITLSGRVSDRGVLPGEAAARLCADLAPPGAPWALQSDPPPPGGSGFVLRGSFVRRPAAPEQPRAAPGDTPDALERGEAGFAEACARLSPTGSFGERLSALERRGWTAAGLATDRRNGYELRHYLLRYRNPRLGDWPEIVASIRVICDEPGLTIERLFLTAAPDGAAVFIRAELGLTVRLKPQAVFRAGAYDPPRRRIWEPSHSATIRLSRSC